MLLQADSKTDQTVWMAMLIRVFAGRTDHFVGFVMLKLISVSVPYKYSLECMLCTHMVQPYAYSHRVKQTRRVRIT